MQTLERIESHRQTKQELEFLGFRQHLKEKAREWIKNESAAVNDNYGSFFRPSKNVISRRLLEERQAVFAKTLNPTSVGKSKTYSANAEEKLIASDELKMRAQLLKETRDYSFLFSDDAVPAFREVSAPLPSSDAQPAKAPSKSVKPPVSNSHAKRNSIVKQLVPRAKTRMKALKEKPSHDARKDQQKKRPMKQYSDEKDR